MRKKRQEEQVSYTCEDFHNRYGKDEKWYRAHAKQIKVLSEWDVRKQIHLEKKREEMKELEG